jgi:integrating conjugative element membrane protein (TIGR03747 family)
MVPRQVDTMADAPSRPIRTGVWYLAWRFPLILLTAMFVHVMMASWVWPDGHLHLKGVLARDMARIQALETIDKAGPLAARWASGAYRWMFEETGFNGMIRAFSQPAGVNPPDTEVRKLVVHFWPEIQAAMYSVQILGERMAVLFLTLPLFLVATLIAVSDGWAGRWLRRAHGGRESAFLYHRLKRSVFLTIVLLWTVWLIMPVSMDPRAVIFPFVILFAVTVRFTIGYFKKYF